MIIIGKIEKNIFLSWYDEINLNNKSDYDCLIPVSGGKDSYFQAHLAKKYGLKILFVTYHGNNYLPAGDANRDNMRHVFNDDHIVFGPSVETLKKLNRICFKKMGDMNWHAHCGIHTYHSDSCKVWHTFNVMGRNSMGYFWYVFP